MKWHNDVVRAELEKHAAIVAPKRVGVVATPAAHTMYADTLKQLANKLKILDPSAPDSADIGVITVIAENHSAAWHAYSKTMMTINVDIPVVYCLPDRRIATAPPSWENSGISYDGMFKLASLYAPTVTRGGGGSYVEFGVYDGRSFILACHALKDVCRGFFAFDSFAGIRGTQQTEETHFKDRQYSASLQTLHYNLRFAGIEGGLVTTVAGYFQDSIKGKHPREFGIEAAAIVHIDTDVYEPALLALEFISPALPQGALLLFDDFDHLAASNEKGERRAAHEWLQAHPELELEPFRNYALLSRAFIVHRRG